MSYLISKLQECYEGNPWFGESLMVKLKGLDHHSVNARPLPSQNSVARLVQHIINWRIFAIKKLEGDREFDIRQDAQNDWTDVQIGSRSDWEQMLEALRDTQEKLVRLLSAKDDTFLSTTVPGREYDYRHLIEGLIQHDIYHLGQIALINKIKG